MQNKPSATTHHIYKTNKYNSEKISGFFLSYGWYFFSPFLFHSCCYSVFFICSFFFESFLLSLWILRFFFLVLFFFQLLVSVPLVFVGCLTCSRPIFIFMYGSISLTHLKFLALDFLDRWFYVGCYASMCVGVALLLVDRVIEAP